MEILHNIDQDTKWWNINSCIDSYIKTSNPQYHRIHQDEKFDLGISHNFIDKVLVESFNYFVYLVGNFQVLVANGWSTDCGGKFRNIKLSMGYYNLSSYMHVISIRGVDVVLGIQWLRNLDTIFEL